MTAASLWLRHMLAPALMPAVHSAFNVPLQNQDVRHKVGTITRRKVVREGGRCTQQGSVRSGSEAHFPAAGYPCGCSTEWGVGSHECHDCGLPYVGLQTGS